MAWYKIASASVLQEPFIRKVKVGSRSICLINDDNKLYALSSKCPHAGADLSAGWCTGGKLVCPYHRYSYDLQTGRGSEGQNDYVKTYPVDIRNDGIYVEVISFAERSFLRWFS